MSNRPEETVQSKIINIVLPSLICLIIFSVSLYLDVTEIENKMFWLQRSGSIITILGAWIAFHEARESIKLIGTDLYFETELPYKYYSIILVFLGTALWGYGDIPFK